MRSRGDDLGKVNGSENFFAQLHKQTKLRADAADITCDIHLCVRKTQSKPFAIQPGIQTPIRTCTFGEANALTFAFTTTVHVKSWAAKVKSNID